MVNPKVQGLVWHFEHRARADTHDVFLAQLFPIPLTAETKFILGVSKNIYWQMPYLKILGKTRTVTPRIGTLGLYLSFVF